jgi:hypothetical protein
MFLLVRYLKLGNFAALIAGVCFGLGGFVQWTAWLNILNAMPWLPLIVLFVLRAHASERSSEQLINASVAGLALGMTWLAGSVHIAIMDSIAAASLIAYLWLSNRCASPVSLGRHGAGCCSVHFNPVRRPSAIPVA